MAGEGAVRLVTDKVEVVNEWQREGSWRKAAARMAAWARSSREVMEKRDATSHGIATQEAGTLYVVYIGQ
jgi:hypothetical protein